MDLGANHSRDTLEKILVVLRNLLQTEEGGEIYDHIEAGYKISGKFTEMVDHAFVSFLDGRLNAYIKNVDSDPATRMVARLVQRRVIPYLANADTGINDEKDLEAVLVLALQQAADNVKTIQQEDIEALETAHRQELKESAQAEAEKIPRANLTRQRRELESLQSTIDKNLQQILARNTDFLSNLKTIRVTMENSGGEEMQQVLLESVDEMIAWQDALKGDLDHARKNLKTMRAGNMSLHAEIINVRKLTQTDEFTGLPNRVALIRSLQSENARSVRYKTPLSLAIISIDGQEHTIKKSADLADEIIRIYVEDVMSGFRGYDMIARIGVNEFALLLPNTPIDGARRAMAEAQHRSGLIKFECNGKSETLPTFICGIAEIQENEDADVFLARTDAALKSAQDQGVSSIVVAATA
jgi:diguanylate cyclase (GGDEF)-like protein